MAGGSKMRLYLNRLFIKLTIVGILVLILLPYIFSILTGEKWGDFVPKSAGNQKEYSQLKESGVRINWTIPDSTWDSTEENISAMQSHGENYSNTFSSQIASVEQLDSNNKTINIKVHFTPEANQISHPDIIGGISTKSNTYQDTPGNNKSQVGIPINNSESDVSSYKEILLYTKYVKTRWFRIKKYDPNVFQGCEYHQCTVSVNRSRVAEADVLVFAYDKLQEEGITWPEVRTLNQLYVHLMWERPGRWHEFLREYDDKINLTMNYREDADLYSVTRQVYEKSTPSDSYTLKVPLQNRTRMVLWPVSHCNAESKRDDYAHELRKYISIDIFGRCGNLTCERKSWNSCYGGWHRHYKFYLAFENSICDGYVTEKLYNALSYQMIPIVLGGADYTKAAPPYSYIDVQDFESPQKLAEYLHFLSNNEEEFNKYFEWMKSYMIDKGLFKMCLLCEAAHKNSMHHPAHRHYYDWWFSGCHNDLMDKMRMAGGW